MKRSFDPAEARRIALARAVAGALVKIAARDLEDAPTCIVGLAQTDPREIGDGFQLVGPSGPVADLKTVAEAIATLAETIVSLAEAACDASGAACASDPDADTRATIAAIKRAVEAISTTTH
jgi:hypothetical protein